MICLIAVVPATRADDDIVQVLIPAPADPEASWGLVYADAEKHIVMEYDLGRSDNDKVFFTDGHPLFNLTDAESYALANTPGLLSKFTNSKGLTSLEYIFGSAALGPGVLTWEDLGAPQCQWPYGTKFIIKRNKMSSIEVMFFHRLHTPRSNNYHLYCAGGPGGVKLTTQFENLPATIFVDPNGEPLIAFRKPAVVLRFNAAGTSIELHGAAGIVSIPAGPVEHLSKMVAEGEISPQDAMNRIEVQLGNAKAKIR